jgi:PucR-like helix-turn-helix protein
MEISTKCHDAARLGADRVRRGMSSGDAHTGSDELIALLDGLEAESESLLAEIRARLERQFPSYEGLPPAVLDAHLRASLGHTLRSTRTAPTDDGDAALADMAQVGEAEAEHGIPVDDLLGVWRIGLQVGVARARELATELGLGDATALDFAQAALVWSDLAMGASARAHRRAELEISRRDQERRGAFAAGVLQGTLAVTAIRKQADAYGIDMQRQYVAIRGRPTGGAASWELERALGFHTAAPHRLGLSTLIAGDVAGFLSDPPRDLAKGLVGVGPPRTVERLAESFRLATRALTTAAGFGLTGVHDLESLGVRPAIVADQDVADALRSRYLDPLSATSSGSEILSTITTWFEHGMHVERAAEAQHIHPNTLRYRIARFEQLTGTSLRETTVAFEVWWALQAASAATDD